MQQSNPELVEQLRRQMGGGINTSSSYNSPKLESWISQTLKLDFQEAAVPSLLLPATRPSDRFFDDASLCLSSKLSQRHLTLLPFGFLILLGKLRCYAIAFHKPL